MTIPFGNCLNTTLFFPPALALWTSLDRLNHQLAQTLMDLSTLYEEDPHNYTASVKYIASLQPIQVRSPVPAQSISISQFLNFHIVGRRDLFAVAPGTNHHIKIL